MTLKVIHTNILVKLVPDEEDIIVSPQESAVVKAVVQEIGEGTILNGNITPMLVRPDSVVWFDKNRATELPFDKTLFVLDQDDILVIEED